MKKVFLLLAGSAFMLSAGAQERHSSILFNGGIQQKQTIAAKNPIAANIADHSTLGTAAKTTATGGARWYNYGDYLAGVNGTSGVGFSAPYIWNDTASKDAYGDGSGGTEYDYNNFVSIGMSFDPFFPGFNDATNYGGDAIGIGMSNAYTIDSVTIDGVYGRNYSNAAKIAVVDTIRLGFVYGNGSSTSALPKYYFGDQGNRANFPYPEYSVDTLRFIDMLHDSLHNIAATASGATTTHVDILLTSSDTANDYMKTVYVPGFTVPAGNYAAMSITFISGDHTFVHGDTVFTGSTTGPAYKYGAFRPYVEYVGSSTSPSFPIYSVDDQNVGFYKQEGASDANWVGNYVPSWAWTSTGGTASTLQYPYVGFHVMCSTCIDLAVASVANNISGVRAFPNPSSSELNISFSLIEASNVTVSLTNTIGQVVATQNVGNVSSGKATFNTAALPAGVYAYSVVANGQRSNGTVVIAH